jgi:hypothetical protein
MIFPKLGKAIWEALKAMTTRKVAKLVLDELSQKGLQKYKTQDQFLWQAKIRHTQQLIYT